MALVFCDGCDSYSATADVAKKWSATASWTYNATAGRNGGGALTASGAQSALYTATGLTTGAELCIGFWIKVSTTPSALCLFIVPYTTALGNTNCVAITASGTLAIYATLLGVNLRLGPGLRNICDNTWHWLEIDLNTQTGTTNKIYIDGTLELSGSTGSAGTTTADRIAFYNPTTTTCTLDDVMIWDNTAGGPVFSSIPLGPREITTLRPDADNTQTFLRSAGAANYSLVNEQAYDSDTTYVESGTSGDQDLYEYGTFGVNPANITAVMLNSVLINPNPGTINFQGACKSNATTTLGTSTITPSVYSTKQQQYGVDPNTAAAWTGANLANAKFGIKVA